VKITIKKIDLYFDFGNYWLQYSVPF
jgi:hypothetical protein